MKKIFIFLAILNFSVSFSQTRIHASITANIKELGIKYNDAEQILKTETPSCQYFFTNNSVLINLYKIDGRLITLFIDESGKLIACHSRKIYT